MSCTILVVAVGRLSGQVKLWGISSPSRLLDRAELVEVGTYWDSIK
jgi:hypothetical protein